MCGAQRELSVAVRQLRNIPELALERLAERRFTDVKHLCSVIRLRRSPAVKRVRIYRQKPPYSERARECELEWYRVRL